MQDVIKLPYEIDGKTDSIFLVRILPKDADGYEPLSTRFARFPVAIYVGPNGETVYLLKSGEDLIPSPTNVFQANNGDSYAFPLPDDDVVAAGAEKAFELASNGVDGVECSNIPHIAEAHGISESLRIREMIRQAYETTEKVCN